MWLCRPGVAPDPCATDLRTTVIAADGSAHVQPAPAVRPTGIDCFYVYPTVSQEQSANADLRIQPAESRAAIAQAARFSSVCRVWAPMYRQRTTGDLLNLADDTPTSAPNRIAFASVESAWRDYLAHDNDGRPFVLLGHSQGAAMLIRLIRADIDDDPAVRAHLVLALLIGGNVTVRTGTLIGGSFRHIPLCSHRAQRGCVIAYSSFPGVPPPGSLFGRPGTGVSTLTGETASAGLQVACVNPAAIGGGSAPLQTYFPTADLPGATATTAWTAYPGRYDAQCRHTSTVTWLQVSATGGRRDRRPTLTEDLGPAWGYHVEDVNLALGDLVDDVAVATAHR